jgi:hypothetical protein
VKNAELPERIIRIGGGDPIDPACSMPQLVDAGELDYLIVDYLSEFSLPLYAHNRATRAGPGFGAGFVGPELTRYLPDILAQGVKIITNAGALDPRGCASAAKTLAEGLGLRPKIAVVEGDDLLDHQDRFRTAGYRDMFSGQCFPAKAASINAYIGAAPIVAALAAGADIVITGRVVDSALSLAPLIFEFGWTFDDYDRLASGVLIGHLLECGAQPVGGIFTDWRDVPNWADISYPIAECRADGSAVLTKVEGTGGLVSVGTVSEQAIYEIGDPQRYFMPDVTCDFTQVQLEQVGPDRVRIAGARGYPPTSQYKTSIAWQDGWRATASFVLRGVEASAKADRVANALLERTNGRLNDANCSPWASTSIELIGSEASYGAHARPTDSREIVCRMVVNHQDKSATEMFLRAQRAISVSMAPGIATVALGATVAPVYRVFSFLLDKEHVSLGVAIDREVRPVAVATSGGFRDSLPARPDPLPVAAAGTASDTVPLLCLAWTRSGDKSDMSNIAVIARHPDYVPYLNAALSIEMVTRWYAHLFERPEDARVERFELPGLYALNFLLHGALGGGGSASLRFDPMGKALAQQLLDFPVPVSPAILRTLQSERPSGTSAGYARQRNGLTRLPSNTKRN